MVALSVKNNSNGSKGGWFVMGLRSRMNMRVDGLVPWKGNKRKVRG